MIQTDILIIGAGPTRYPRGLASSREKAANRRARALPAEYHHKLAVIDSQYCGTRPGEVGPCVARVARAYLGTSGWSF